MPLAEEPYGLQLRAALSNALDGIAIKLP